MKSRPNHILVPIDFNELSLIAAEQSFNIARKLNLEITLLYVIEESGILQAFFPKDQNQVLEENIRAKMRKIADGLNKNSRIKVNIIVSRGKIHNKIVELADEINAKFIVMGTKSTIEENGKIKKVVGAHTSRVIRTSSKPVITINSKHHYHGVRSILLPLDLTRETRQKVSIAIEIARYFNANIKVMSALWSKGNKDIIARLEFQINQVKKFIESEGVKCTAEIIDSSSDAKTAVPIVLKYAKDQGDIDLIVVMTQNELGIAEFFISSSAHDLIRNSDIPVLSVIPRELEFTSIT